MSRLAKIAWLISAISMIMLVAARSLVGGWIDLLAIPLLIFLFSFFVAIMADLKFYAEFLMLRTTKHGMNMGAALLLAIVSMVVVNYFSIRFDSSWDVTDEKLNSLSPQSVKILERLNSDIQFYIFYQGVKDRSSKNHVVDMLQIFRRKSKFIKVRSVDAYVDRVLAQKFLKDIKNPVSPLVIAEYKGKRVKLDQPYTEVQVTTAIIKATRKESRTIYFLTGHGERSIEGKGEDTISDLAASLRSSSYNVKLLNLFESEGKIPKDASVIAIVGPRSPFLPVELKTLIEYSRSGGKIFVAADPGQRHSVPLLTKVFGIEYKNNYILNDRIKLIGRGAASSLGMVFDPKSEITEGFRTGEDMTLFDLASQVVKAPDGPTNLEYHNLVLSPPSSFVVNNLKKANVAGNRSSIAIGISVSGPLTGRSRVVKGKEKVTDSNSGGDAAKEFAAVVFGDSDFISSASFFQGMNRDLAMNVFGYLSKEKDLISVRAKAPKGTKLVVTSAEQAAIVLIGIAIPVFWLIAGVVFWYRRRGA